MKRYFAGLVLAALVVLLWGCDIGVNPLLFDGAKLHANYHVQSSTTSFSASETIDSAQIADVVSEVDKQIDSVKVYNITIKVDSTGGTNPATTVSGSLLVNGHTFLTLTNVPISTFSTEISVLDPSVASAGVSINRPGLEFIVNQFKNKESLPTSLTLVATGSTSHSPVDFWIHLTIYTQIFTAGK